MNDSEKLISTLFDSCPYLDEFTAHDVCLRALIVRSPMLNHLSENAKDSVMTCHLQSHFIFVLILLMTPFLGCDDENRAPTLLPLQELTWSTNSARSVELVGTDPDGDVLTFTFNLSPPPPTETEGLTGAPSIVSLSAQKALFQWSPGAGDVGEYSLTVKVRDPSGAQAEESVTLNVISSGIAGGVTGAQMTFVEPAGAGISVERTQTGDHCLRDLQILVRAEAIPDEEIMIEIREPSPEGAMLLPSGGVGKEKSLTWCPTLEQLSVQERFTFSLYAYQIGAEEAGVTKRFLVRFSRPNRENCPGEPPVIEHEVRPEVSGLADYQIDVHILDDYGVKSPPLLAYLVSPRQDPRIEAAEGWTLTEFESTTPSDEVNIGSYWSATIPNLNLSEGQSAPIYYRIIATDNDDASGSACDQTTESPIYLTTAIGGGAGGAQGVCSPCSHNGQCGGPEDLCLTYTEGQFCGQSCTLVGSQCPEGSQCFELITSEGEQVYQCVPISGACVSQCTPDAYDGNGGEEVVPQLAAGRYPNLAICREDADYYWITIPSGAGLTVDIQFADPLLDLDLAVALEFDAQGMPIYDYQSTQASGSSERVELACAGGVNEALVVVYPYRATEGSYTLTVETPTGECGQLCLDDQYESANPVLIPADIISNLKICPGDTDRYEFEVDQDQVMSILVNLVASQGALDVRLFDPNAQVIEERTDGRDTALLEHRARQSGRYSLEISGATSLITNHYSIDVYLFDAVACQSTQDCDHQSFCEPSLGCLEDICNSSWSCGAVHSCVTSPINVQNDEGHCRAECYNESSCRMGEACKPMPNYETLCIPEGTGGLGDPCSDHHECVGTLVCVPSVFGVGVCVDVACDAALPCPEGESCVTLEGTSVCATNCAQSSCPGELRCEQREGQALCIP